MAHQSGNFSCLMAPAGPWELAFFLGVGTYFSRVSAENFFLVFFWCFLVFLLFFGGDFVFFWCFFLFFARSAIFFLAFFSAVTFFSRGAVSKT